MDKRLVSDILDVPDGGPVSFIQHVENGEMFYEPVCPWCGETQGTDRLKARTYGDLFAQLYAIQVLHMGKCSGRMATEMAVQLKGKPLGPRD